MATFETWKKNLAIFVCLLGLFYCLPNFLGSSMKTKLPTWWQPVSLGLDLQGGSHIVLEVKFDEVIKERLSATEDAIRSKLIEKHIRYTDLKVQDDKINVTIINPADKSDAKSLIRKEINQGVNTSFEIEDVNDHMEIGYSEQAIIALQDKVLSQSIEIVRRRIDQLGTKEPTIQRQGRTRIIVQLPGVENPEHVKSLLGKTAKLSFHMVDDISLNDARRGKLPPSSMLIEGGVSSREGAYIVKRLPVVTGEHLTDSRPSFQDGEAVVTFEFDSIGAKAFGNATRENIGHRLAIVLDNEVISAPEIKGAITGGSGIISGSFTSESANELSLLLRSGALPAPLQVLEERTVGPSLGADSIRLGGISCLIGLALVVAFMIAAYGTFGVITSIAVLLNLMLLIGGLSFLGATLTLPGIAGIVLTMGMAVDANVLIFERMREESKKGIPVMKAIIAGFQNAFVTIVDSNLTTMVAALVLFNFGSGPVRGFAVTLALGIITSMFTSTMITRLLVFTWLQSKKPSKLPI